MATSPQPVYWDSCCFIDCIQRTAGRHEVLDKIIAAAEQRKITIVISTLVIAEVVKLDVDRPMTKVDADKITKFFENEYIAVRQLDRPTAEYAAQIGRMHGLKPPDAIHVATAIRAKCCALQTYDGPRKRKGLVKFDGKIGNPPLTIEIPRFHSDWQPPEQAPLFAEPRGAADDGRPPRHHLPDHRCPSHPLRQRHTLERKRHPLAQDFLATCRRLEAVR